MRRACLVLLSACSFERSGTSAPDTDGTEHDASAADVDASPDAEPPIALCAPSPGLLVCFSFDADPLPATMANEGTAGVSAQLTNVGRIAMGGGGAARFDGTSLMRIAPNAETTGFLSVEAWVRIDADPPAGQRVGIIDADATSSAVSFFYYFPSPNRQIRFEIGQQLFLDHTLALTTWHYLAQVCEANTLSAYVDGTKIGERTGCSAGNATTFGLQFGQNNTGSGGDQPMTGAIDGVRMWTVPLSAATICQTSGRTDC